MFCGRTPKSHGPTHENILFSSCKKCPSSQKRHTIAVISGHDIEWNRVLALSSNRHKFGWAKYSNDSVSVWRGIVNCGTRDDDSSANKRFHEVCGASAAMCVRGNPWTLLRWASLALANVQTRSRRISRPSRVLLLLLPHHQKTPIKRVASQL